MDIFGNQGKTKDIPQGLLTYFPDVFDAQESAELLSNVIYSTPWEQRVVYIYGKRINTPRLTAWYGDTDKYYAFSGTTLQPLPWTLSLKFIKERIEQLTDVTFNSVLLNYYRDSQDSVAWHSDDEKELGERPIIASVSFGQVRQFDIRSKVSHADKYSIRLGNGSVLVMRGDLQQHWEHRIPKSVVPMKARVNLTFRLIQ